MVIGPVVVVGGGVAGIESSLCLSKQGVRVYLLERNFSLGGNVSLLSKVFPTLDPTSNILDRMFKELRNSENIQIMTNIEIKAIEKTEEGFELQIIKKPRHVDVNKCISCGKCSEVCPVEYDREYELGIGKRKAIDSPSVKPFPEGFAIDERMCLHFKGEECYACVESCPNDAINLDERSEETRIQAKALILATGMELFDVSRVKELGYGRYKDVITSLELERMLDPEGPTKGEVVRPSNMKRPRSVAFVLCAGSRDRRFLKHCCRIGCMTALKQAYEIRQLYGEEVEVYVCYNDIRATGRMHEEFYQTARDSGIIMLHGIPSEIREKDGRLTLRIFDVGTWKLEELNVDLVILIPGVTSASNAKEVGNQLGVQMDEDTFFKTLDPLRSVNETQIEGVFLSGCSAGPMDIMSSISHARAAALSALIYLKEKERALKS
ncbi:MAG: hypothetical protein DRO00_00315 [Thermoproteota archaeon]|nr:MAG: hypothetical protein DRO00_00315 [Candidatus Korarchaeota archaeon]